MSVLSSVSLLLTLFLLPVASVAEVAENQVKETVQECQQVQEQTEDWRLLLVNGWSPMPEEYEVTLKKLPGGLQVDERVYDDLTAMLADCGKAGLHPIVCSAYRDMETQTRLHKNKIARLRAAGYSQEAAEQEALRWVAAPGASEHHTGMAVDIVQALLDNAEEGNLYMLIQHPFLSIYLQLSIKNLPVRKLLDQLAYSRYQS